MPQNKHLISNHYLHHKVASIVAMMILEVYHHHHAAASDRFDAVCPCVSAIILILEFRPSHAFALNVCVHVVCGRIIGAAYITTDSPAHSGTNQK